MTKDKTQKNLLSEVKWFDTNDMLSYGCLHNFVVGDRGGGKTFNVLKFLINRFKKHGEQFVYLRRTQEEIKDSCSTLFDDLKKHGFFPDDELVSTRKTFTCNGKVMGIPRALSTSMTRKSIALPNVKWILFEEFMVDGKKSRYLAPGEQEVDMYRNLYESIARMRELKEDSNGKLDLVRTIFISNAFSTVNIYFTSYNIKINPNPPYKRYNRFGDNMVVIWHEKSYHEVKKQTRWYKLNAGTTFNEHAYENRFYLDDETFIKHKTKEAEFNFALTYIGQQFTVWVDWDKGEYYVTTKGGDITKDNNISLSLEDNKPNNTNIRRVKNMPFMRFFRIAVEENKVYYDSLKTYHLLKEAVYLLKTTS